MKVNEKGASSVMLRIVLVLFIVFILLAIASTRLVYNQLRDEYAELVMQNEKLGRDIEKTRSYLLSQFDEDYIRRIARENGYCDPDEVIVEK